MLQPGEGSPGEQPVRGAAAAGAARGPPRAAGSRRADPAAGQGSPDWYGDTWVGDGELQVPAQAVTCRVLGSPEVGSTGFGVWLT